MKSRNFVLFSLISLFFACSNSSSFEKNSHQEIIDLLIEKKDGTAIEFNSLYDNLIDKIPEKSTCFTLDYLEEIGFEKINSGRGNFPRGPRIVSYTLEKYDCQCEVSKLYYYTDLENLFEESERISCTKK